MPEHRGHYEPHHCHQPRHRHHRPAVRPEQDASTQAIADAKAFCDSKGIKYIEKNGTTTAEVQMAAEALVAAGVKAVFTPTDNTVMTAELSIYETFLEQGSSTSPARTACT